MKERCFHGKDVAVGVSKHIHFWKDLNLLPLELRHQENRENIGNIQPATRGKAG